MGMRGSALSRGYTNFKAGSVPETIATSNEETMLLVQIETKAALENIEEIVTVPGVDMLFVGPNDLSISLGVPGQIDHPEMRAAIEKVIAVCRQHGVFPGAQMNDLELAIYWAKKGIRLLSSVSEAGLMTRAGLEVTTVIKPEFEC